MVLLPVAGHGRRVRLGVRGLIDQSRVVRDGGGRVGATAVTVAAAQERGRRVIPRKDALQSLDKPAVNALVIGELDLVDGHLGGSALDPVVTRMVLVMS